MGEKVKVIEIFKKSEKVQPTGVITFHTGLDNLLEPGEYGILTPEADNTDKIILNPLYTGGELLVKMRIIGQPAKMFKNGDKIANLVIMG